MTVYYLSLKPSIWPKKNIKQNVDNVSVTKPEDNILHVIEGKPKTQNIFHSNNNDSVTNTDGGLSN